MKIKELSFPSKTNNVSQEYIVEEINSTVQRLGQLIMKLIRVVCSKDQIKILRTWCS